MWHLNMLIEVESYLKTFKVYFISISKNEFSSCYFILHESSCSYNLKFKKNDERIYFLVLLNHISAKASAKCTASVYIHVDPSKLKKKNL